MPAKPSVKRSLFLWAGLVLGALWLFYFLPLFHVVPLKAARQQSASAVFDANAYVENFWNTQLLPAKTKAIEVEKLLAAFRQDPTEAVNQFGHRLGLSSTTSFFISGQGKIVEADPRSVSIALNGTAQGVVIIETGPVFGNAIRDGSGLLNINDFANSRDFNAISSEINRRVEERVFPVLKDKAVLGASIQFVGCADITDPETDLAPLRVVPIFVEIQ